MSIKSQIVNIIKYTSVQVFDIPTLVSWVENEVKDIEGIQYPVEVSCEGVEDEYTFTVNYGTNCVFVKITS